MNIVDASDNFVFNAFNHGRQLDNKVIKGIVDLMVDGRCKNASNPLIIAIGSTEVDPETLTQDYNQNSHKPELRTIRFKQSSQKLIVLAGFHRITAAQKVVTILRKRLVDVQTDAEKAQEEYDGDDFNPDEVQPEGDPLHTLNDQALTIEDLIKRVEIWPVRFYDIGSSQIPSTAQSHN